VFVTSTGARQLEARIKMFRQENKYNMQLDDGNCSGKDFVSRRACYISKATATQMTSERPEAVAINFRSNNAERASHSCHGCSPELYRSRH
jgi:predicted metal-binding protein